MVDYFNKCIDKIELITEHPIQLSMAARLHLRVWAWGHLHLILSPWLHSNLVTMGAFLFSKQ